MLPFLNVPYVLQYEIVRKMNLKPALRLRLTSKYGTHLVSECKTKLLEMYRSCFEGKKGSTLISLWEDGIDFAVGNMEYIQFMEHLVGRGLIEQLESRDRQRLWQVYHQLQDELTIWEEFHQMERPPIAIHFEQMADKINDGSIYTGEQRRIRRVRPPKGRGGRLGRRAIRYRAK